MFAIKTDHHYYCLLLVIVAWICCQICVVSSDSDRVERGLFPYKLIYPPGRIVWLDKSLTVNVTHYIILGVLSVLVHILGYFGFTLGLGTTGKKRSVKDDRWIWQETFVGLVSNGSNDFRCLYRIACEQPNSGRQYADAGELFHDMITYINKYHWISNSTLDFYKNCLKELRLAVNIGSEGGNCPSVYPCLMFNKNGNDNVKTQKEQTHLFM